MYRQYRKELSLKSKSQLIYPGSADNNKGNHSGNIGSTGNIFADRFIEYIYGGERRRKKFWERDNERKNKRRNKGRSGSAPIIRHKPDPQKPAPPKPEPPKEAINKRLVVKGVNLCIDVNTNDENQRTKEYACTEDRVDKDTGEAKPAELVIRRGALFKVGITFDRPFINEKNDTKIMMKLGEHPKPNNGTKAIFDVNETNRKTFAPTEWGANLMSKSGNDITLEIHVPANCIVGEWELCVKSFSIGKDKEGKETTLCYQYTHNEDINILFNPWCKDDLTYMETKDLLDEYVLNENGCVYRGSSYNLSGKSWIFGQDGILDAALTITREGFGDKNIAEMSNPIMVSRIIAKMVNCQDDGGVLAGNWSGKYEGGVNPSKWGGSVKILNKYMKTGEPVQFGQCWVFSAVTTTVCRALGIPCRSVTNFASAHDTNGTNTIETFWEADKNGDMVKASGHGGDSVWNFHVWNECWFARPDLGESYTGWQVIDGTPQETSSHMEEATTKSDKNMANSQPNGAERKTFIPVPQDDTQSNGDRKHLLVRGEDQFTCGPCPVIAVKNGYCNVGFDTGFVFAEVNADRLHWNVVDGAYSLNKKKTKKGRKGIGQKISTKKPNGLRYKDVCYTYEFEDQRLDVTGEYKHTECSKSERSAVKNARKFAKGKNKLIPDYSDDDDDDEKQLVRIKLDHSNEVCLGETLDICAEVTNLDDKPHQYIRGAIRAFVRTYTGVQGPLLYEQKFERENIGVDQKDCFKMAVTPEMYLSQRLDQCNLDIEATVSVINDNLQIIYKAVSEHEFRFRRPDLDVKICTAGKTTATPGETVQFTVTFTNPLPFELTDSTLDVDCNDMKESDEEIKVPTVAANGVFEGTFTVTCMRPGTKCVAVGFDSKQLTDISGSTEIIIVK